MKPTAILLLSACLSYAQTTKIDLARQGKNVDFSAAPATKPAKTGAALPETCQTGEVFFLTTAAPGANLRVCAAPGEWASTGDVQPGAIQDGRFLYCEDTGTLNAYACTLVPPINAYAAGMVFHVRAATANTGAATLNVNGIGARPVFTNGNQPLNPNEVRAGQVVTFVYDGAAFQMQSQPGTYVEPGPSLALKYDRTAYPNTIDFDTNLVCLKSSYCAPTGGFDLSSASSTKPSRMAASDPELCTEGENYYNTVSDRRRDCIAPNTWEDSGIPAWRTQGRGVFAPWGTLAVSGSGSFTAATGHYYKFTAGQNWTVRRVAMHSGALEENKSVAVSIYDSTCASKLGSGRITGAAAGAYAITLDSPVRLSAGSEYYFGWAHESPSTSFAAAFGPETAGFYNVGASPMISVGAAAQGTGPAFAMPDSCGSLNASPEAGAVQYALLP